MLENTTYLNFAILVAQVLGGLGEQLFKKQIK